MQFLLGLLTAVIFFICLGIAFHLGQRTRIKTPTSLPISEDEKRRLREVEQYNKHFKALFNYDVSKALERKKVT